MIYGRETLKLTKSLKNKFSNTEINEKRYAMNNSKRLKRLIWAREQTKMTAQLNKRLWKIRKREKIKWKKRLLKNPEERVEKWEQEKRQVEKRRKGKKRKRDREKTKSQRERRQWKNWEMLGKKDRERKEMKWKAERREGEEI